MQDPQQQRGNTPANRQTPIHGTSLKPSQDPQPQMLPAAAKALESLKPALTRLAALKNAVALTPFALETWVAGLSVFEPAIVNEAVLRIAVSPDPWPDFGKLFAKCEEVRRRVAGSQASAVEPSIDQSLRKVASALQLPMPSLSPPYHQAPRRKDMPA